MPAWVFVEDNLLLVQVGEHPPTQLEAINPFLARGWPRQYVLINDYDKDGLKDIAVLQSVGHGGLDRCYAIYRYNLQAEQFNSHKSFDRCNL